MSEPIMEALPNTIAMRPIWRDLLFLHWEFDPETVQKLLPEGLEVDTFNGRAYVGLVPFMMGRVRPNFIPDVGRFGHWYENFAELNVRTYVKRNGISGVWFFSLDAASTPAVLTARAWFGLPYFRARMRFGADGTRLIATIHTGYGQVPLPLIVAFAIGLKERHSLPHLTHWRSFWWSDTCCFHGGAAVGMWVGFTMNLTGFNTHRLSCFEKIVCSRQGFPDRNKFPTLCIRRESM